MPCKIVGGTKVPGNKKTWERKFLGTKGPGNESSQELKVPENERARERKFQGTFVPGNESSRERKVGPCKYPKDGERRLSPAKDGERRLSPSFRTKDVFRRPKDNFCRRKTLINRVIIIVYCRDKKIEDCENML